MSAYTVIGWRIIASSGKVEVLTDHFNVRGGQGEEPSYSAARAALEHRRSTPGYSLLAVFANKLRLEAGIYHVSLQPPVNRTRREPYTIIGVWRHIGECLCTVVEGHDASHAITLARGKIGSIEERLMLGAFGGRHEPLLRVENLPPEFRAGLVKEEAAS